MSCRSKGTFVTVLWRPKPSSPESKLRLALESCSSLLCCVAALVRFLFRLAILTQGVTGQCRSPRYRCRLNSTHMLPFSHFRPHPQLGRLSDEDLMVSPSDSICIIARHAFACLREQPTEIMYQAFSADSGPETVHNLHPNPASKHASMFVSWKRSSRFSIRRTPHATRQQNRSS